MIKVLGVTGIRSEYDIMSSVYKAIVSEPNLELELVVTGAHLSDSYGLTVDEIRRDGFVVADEIESLINGDQASARVKGLAVQLQGLVQTVVRVKPDWLLVLGDREESMTTALVGAYLNIPVAHVAGGDRVVGNVDDQVRHAVTKLSHLHFVTNEDSAARILKMGEQAFRVLNVGNPGLDRLLAVPKLTRDELYSRLDIKVKRSEPLLVLIQHVISTEIEQAYDQMRITLDALAKLGLPTVVIYPNSDAGGQQLIRAIDEDKSFPHIHVFRNLPRLEFVNLLRHASCLVGNSSAGILEAPLLKLPVVNVGNRQKGRLAAENVRFVPHEKHAICEAINKACFDPKYRDEVAQCTNPYGDGNSSQRIARALSTCPVDSRLLIKDLSY